MIWPDRDLADILSFLLTKYFVEMLSEMGWNPRSNRWPILEVIAVDINKRTYVPTADSRTYAGRETENMPRGAPTGAGRGRTPLIIQKRTTANVNQHILCVPAVSDIKQESIGLDFLDGLASSGMQTPGTSTQFTSFKTPENVNTQLQSPYYSTSPAVLSRPQVILDFTQQIKK